MLNAPQNVRIAESFFGLTCDPVEGAQIYALEIEQLNLDGTKRRVIESEYVDNNFGFDVLPNGSYQARVAACDQQDKGGKVADFGFAVTDGKMSPTTKPALPPTQPPAPPKPPFDTESEVAKLIKRLAELEEKMANVPTLTNSLAGQVTALKGEIGLMKKEIASKATSAEVTQIKTELTSSINTAMSRIEELVKKCSQPSQPPVPDEKDDKVEDGKNKDNNNGNKKKEPVNKDPKSGNKTATVIGLVIGLLALLGLFALLAFFWSSRRAQSAPAPTVPPQAAVASNTASANLEKLNADAAALAAERQRKIDEALDRVRKEQDKVAPLPPRKESNSQDIEMISTNGTVLRLKNMPTIMANGNGNFNNINVGGNQTFTFPPIEKSLIVVTQQVIREIMVPQPAPAPQASAESQPQQNVTLPGPGAQQSSYAAPQYNAGYNGYYGGGYGSYGNGAVPHFGSWMQPR